MKHLVTAVAFSVSSFISFAQSCELTPLESILGADKVEVLFTSDTEPEFLNEVQAALAAREIDLQYTRVKYDKWGKLERIAFEVTPAGREAIKAAVKITDAEGAYLFLQFADSEQLG